MRQRLDCAIECRKREETHVTLPCQRKLCAPACVTAAARRVCEHFHFSSLASLSGLVVCLSTALCVSPFRAILFRSAAASLPLSLFTHLSVRTPILRRHPTQFSSPLPLSPFLDTNLLTSLIPVWLRRNQKMLPPEAQFVCGPISPHLGEPADQLVQTIRPIQERTSRSLWLALVVGVALPVVLMLSLTAPSSHLMLLLTAFSR